MPLLSTADRRSSSLRDISGWLDCRLQRACAMLACLCRQRAVEKQPFQHESCQLYQMQMAHVLQGSTGPLKISSLPAAGQDVAAGVPALYCLKY